MDAFPYGDSKSWSTEMNSVPVLGSWLDGMSRWTPGPFVAGNKTDATDARAIWLAIQQPGTKFVGMKTLAQQVTLVLHRQRELLMRMKVMQINALRGLRYEFGATFARGRNALFSEIEATLESLVNEMPQYVADSLREQVQRIKQLAADIKAIEARLAQRLRGDADMKRVAAIPGVGLLTATAAIATMGEAPGWAWCPSSVARVAG